MSTPVITVRSVSKRYGRVVAVDNVTLDVQPGEVYAILGLNGAGKTTLIRMILGMVRTSAGDVEVTKRRVTDRGVWAQVGYLVEAPSAYPELTVRENLEVVRRLRKIPERCAVDEAIDLFGLRSYADRRARALSLGNRQRLGLAKAFLHRPSLLVLDEPVNGLDPAGVAEVRTLLVDLAREQGVTVFLSSHRLAEVARVATRIGVLHNGRLVDEFDADGLASRVRRRLEVGARDTSHAARVLRKAGLESYRAAGFLVLEDRRAVDHPELVATALVRAGEPPTRLAVTEEDLETYFLRLVGAPATEDREAAGVR
ncbi:MAG TPA: ABC transporter ATP-binding protein [Actinopolymorphaceae bacterium]|jgi:ABC-2 type transport system ATP-binding protein